MARNWLGRFWLGRFHQAASFLAAWSLGSVFALFISGIAMRYIFHTPVAWIDEMVTLLSVWSTFWTAAFVLTWSEHIAFDVLFAHVQPALQRYALLVGGTAFIVLMSAAVPGMIDYTLFLWRERTDAMQLRLDWVYAVYPAFFIVVIIRFALSLRRLLSPHWQDELIRWDSSASGDEP